MGPSQHNVPGTDYFTIYKLSAESILEGKGITIEGKLSTKAPAGYPVILSMILGLSRMIGISELELIIIFNLIAVAITCIFLFLIAESIFQKRIDLIASLLWLTYPFNPWFIKNPNTEVFFYSFLIRWNLALYFSFKEETA